MTSEMVHVVSRCPACDGERLDRVAPPGRWIGERVFAPFRDQLGLCRCKRCGLVFVNPRPTALLLDRFYQGDDYGCHLPRDNGETERRAAAQLDVVAREVPHVRRFLDYGCGGGYLLRAALDRGWDAVGYDLGARAIDQCRAQGLPATSDLASLPRRTFDAIYLSHVFEHVPEPGSMLRTLCELLAPNGRVMIEVPNVRSLRARMSVRPLSAWAGVDERYRAFPIHLFYYSRTSLRAMLERYGLTVAAHTTTGLGLDELMFEADEEYAPPPATGTATRPRRSRVRRLARAVFFGAGLGENLLLAARSQ
jgi:SAM-dependent methyltransferase